MPSQIADVFRFSNSLLLCTKNISFNKTSQRLSPSRTSQGMPPNPVGFQVISIWPRSSFHGLILTLILPDPRPGKFPTTGYQGAVSTCDTAGVGGLGGCRGQSTGPVSPTGDGSAYTYSIRISARILRRRDPVKFGNPGVTNQMN
jgi:hypothetical protein